MLLSKGLSVVANIWTMDHTRTFLTQTQRTLTPPSLYRDKYKLVKIKIKVNQNNANDATQLAPITWEIKVLRLVAMRREGKHI